MSASLPLITIFRPGSTPPMSLADLRSLVTSYDLAEEAPIVIGTPKLEDPAYGWIGSLALDGGRVVATAASVNPAFAEAVRLGRYSKVTASIYPPDSPHNPKPGQFYLKHVSFAGPPLPNATRLGSVTAAVAAPGRMVTIAGLPAGYRATQASASLYDGARAIQADNPGISIVDAARAAMEAATPAGFAAPAGYTAPIDDTYRRAKQIHLANPSHPWMQAYIAAQEEDAAISAARAAGPGTTKDQAALHLRAKQLQSRNLDLPYATAIRDAQREIEADRGRPLT